MKTLLVIAPGRNIHRDCVFNLLVADTGEHLAAHLCSDSAYAYGDLYARRTERIEEWTKRFGDLEVKYIDETEITEDELVKRNKAWFESIPKKETAQ